jgi:F420-non-reducing hydrogenase iron-sulfur subunit
MTIKRMTFLQELLSFTGLEGRLHLDWISSAEAQKFVQVVTNFTNKIKSLGPSPLSGDFDLSAVVSLSEATQETLRVEGG